MPTTKKRTKDFTASERAVVLARAEEVGIMTAAEEFGTSWQTVAALQREAHNRDKVPAPGASRKIKKTAGRVKRGRKAASKDLQTTPTAKKGNKKEMSPELENIILKRKVETLTKDVEKLRAAVIELA
ncbi:MAG: hypothetical protein IJT20_05300 [Synergistaceae bacterium]|nr:hypothetical protein [Synergistaceae bacterium]